MKEYIDGDLVRYTSLYKEPIAEICEVRETSYLIRFMNGNFAKVTSKEIKPIPLTTDILEKNGWKKSKINDCAYFYYKDGLFLTYTSKDGKFWFDDFDYSSCICVELPYVHSLQHLLFGLEINQEMEV
jgi:hypothetical protein